MSALRHLNLDDIITSFPELGPTIQDGGYSWIILIGVFLIQMTVPSILSVYGIILGYLTKNNTSESNLWEQKIIMTPMLFVAFWSLMDPWSKTIVDLSSIPRVVGLIGVALISIGVLASGYLATGGVGAYLASLSAGAIMGIGASFVMIQSQECLRKYFRIKLLVAFTLRNIAFSLGYIIVPRLIHMLLMRVSLKAALLLITLTFIPTVLGVAILQQPLPHEPSHYNLLLPIGDDSDIPTKFLSNIKTNINLTQTSNVDNSTSNGMEQQIEHANTSFAGINEIYTYEDSEDEIFVNSATRSGNNWRNQLTIFTYFRLWMIIITWVGTRSFFLFFWLLLPFVFIAQIYYAYDYTIMSIIAGFGTLLPSLITFCILQATPQNRRLLFGIFCWLGCFTLLVLTYTTEYYIFVVCSFLGGVSIGGLLVCQDSVLHDTLGPHFVYQPHKAFSTIVGISLLTFCFINSVSFCFYLVASLLLLSGCYWTWLPIINILKYQCATRN